MAETDVRLEQVTKRFGDVTAVDGISLDIERGEFFSLLGPSGCGKTTTLRLLAGFEEATSGQIFLGGQEVTRVPSFKRNVNTVFQDYALFPHLSVFDNVAFGPRRRGVPSREIPALVNEMLELVQLGPYGSRKPSQLSGGQRQRVALARALVNRPRVLLLDEPLGALDLKLRRQMQTELKHIQVDVGITFIFVTHDQEEAMTMSDRIAVMNAGRVEQIGSPEATYERPATQFVAGFLGASNLLAGKVVGTRADLLEVQLTNGTRILAPGLDGLANGAELRVGVRPEKLRLTPPGGPTESTAGVNALGGVVLDATFSGVSTQYTVQTDAGFDLLVYAQNAGTAEASDRAMHAGDKVMVSWEPRHTYLLAGPAGPEADSQVAVSSAANSSNVPT